MLDAEREEKRLLRRMNVKTALLLAASALLFALPFQFPALFFCTFLAPVPLFCAVRFLQEGQGPWRCLGWGFFFGFLYHLLLYHWLTALHPFTVLGLSGAPSLFLALGAYIGAAAFQGVLFALGFCLFGLVCAWLRPSGNVGALLFSACFLASEGLLSVGTLAFPWSRIALPLAAFPAAMRLAAVVGPYGMDAIVLLFGALVAAGIRRFGRRRLLAFALALLVLAVDLGFGFLGALHTETEAKLRVAVLQTQIASEEKWSSASSVRAALSEAADRAADTGAELIVFPESALNSVLTPGDENERFFASLCRRTGALIASGAVVEENGKTYNAIALFDKNGLIGYAGKRHLVPFGEYLPWQGLVSAVLPELAENTFYRNEYTPGEAGVLGETEKGLCIGGMVCFDSIFPSLARASAEQGAQILCVCTNDSWFKTSPAARQHSLQDVYRAVENGRSVAVSANVGVSALIDPYGRVLDSAEVGEEGIFVASLPLSGERTVYSETGDLVIPAALILLLFFLVLGIVRRRGKL